MAIEAGTNVYAVVADGDAYFEYAIHGEPWRDATVATKERALVTATRILDRQRWDGSKTDSGQALQFPRDGLSDADGNALADNTTPGAVKNGMFELALVLIKNPETQSDGRAGGKAQISSIKTGDVSLDFALPPSDPHGLPAIVRELVGPYIASGVSLMAPRAGGTDVESRAENDKFELGGGL